MHRTLLLLALAVIVSSCAKEVKNGPPPDTATSGSFELLADEALKPAIDSLVAGFNKQTPEAKVTVRYTDAAKALDELIGSKTRLVIIGRPISDAERHILDSAKIDLPEFEVALDGLAAVVSSKSPLNSISLDSIKKLVTGDLKMQYYSTSYLSSTESVLDSIFSFKNKTLAGYIKRFRSTDSVIAAVKSDPAGIGFIGSSWMHSLTAKGDSSLKALRISSEKSPQPVMLHLAYLYQGNYPLASRVCAYTVEVPNSIPRGFLAYAMSADGQRVFMKYDVLPRTQIIKLVPPQ
jgi:phosphate transport system substrate-binding protein